MHKPPFIDADPFKKKQFMKINKTLKCPHCNGDISTVEINYAKQLPELRWQLKSLVNDYVRNTPNLPDHSRGEVQELLIKYLNFVNSITGLIELSWRREKSK